MTEKFDIGLNSRINQFANKINFIRNTSSGNDNNDAEIFEIFANYAVSSNMLEEEFDDVSAISTGLSEGLDGIVIIVNNKIIRMESDLNSLGETEQLKVRIGFIQATTQKSWDNDKFGGFIDAVVKFITKKLTIEPFSSIFSRLLDDSNGYTDRMLHPPKLELYFLSGRTSHDIGDDLLSSVRQKIDARHDVVGELEDIYILQKDEIISKYDAISKYHTVQLKFEKFVQLGQRPEIELGILAIIKFNELRKLLLTSDKNLRDALFIENVRNYIGQTPVNLSIKQTIENSTEKEYFPFLNNGITIICESIEKHRVIENEFILSYPRIINGCQTSHMLYEMFLSLSSEIDEIEIVVKVIATNNNSLKTKIIFAANNQNSITEDLKFINDFHSKIETYFSGTSYRFNTHQLLFERLRGQHNKATPPYGKINIETVAKIYISVIKKEPHKMKSSALAIIQEYQQARKIFNSEPEVDYFYCAVLYYWFSYFITNGVISLKSKTGDMHLLMTCDLILQTNYQNTISKVEYLTVIDNAKGVFIKANEYINEQQDLFERRGFYSSPKTVNLIDSVASKGEL